MVSSPSSGKIHSRIFLIGFMGSGKSTLGSRLARKIGYDFVDMDQLIEETAGMTIPEIFSEHGEQVFRKWEHAILQELCNREHLVVSTGGGAPCHGEMIRIMNENGITIYLRLPPSILKERLIRSKTERPLIKGKSEEALLDFITKLLGERESYYSQATYTVDGLDPEPDAVVHLLSTS